VRQAGSRYDVQPRVADGRHKYLEGVRSSILSPPARKVQVRLTVCRRLVDRFDGVTWKTWKARRNRGFCATGTQGSEIRAEPNRVVVTKAQNARAGSDSQVVVLVQMFLVSWLGGKIKREL
jgi:hypothetical protein